MNLLFEAYDKPNLACSNLKNNFKIHMHIYVMLYIHMYTYESCVE